MATLNFVVFRSLGTGRPLAVWPPVGVSPHGNTKVRIKNMLSEDITVAHSDRLNSTTDPYTVSGKHTTETDVRGQFDVEGEHFRLEIRDTSGNRATVLLAAADPEIIIT